ncbi:MAG TPA: RNA polymerase sigma factor [Steroidobacteraceae bacterium]|nr:RNA polymerase sigma factor [Steroidobacteraceae bacterium]
MSVFLDSDLPPETLARARAGVVDAQEAIYRAYQRPVRTLARRLVAGVAIADDLAQDVFVEVLTKLDQYDGRGSFAGWVRTITVHKCLMHLRSPWQRARRWMNSVGEDGSDGWPERRSTPSAGDAVDLERALARLGDIARAVVWLHDVEGYTHAEIGRLLGGTASFSKSQLARAHVRLRELLEADGVKAPCMPISTSY